ncbi:hypothetical protein CAK95_22595 [Pseudorhodoplanes sinuspersici]|uniref:Uncharacterized protein n=1 Tax=Pseudorhodoplanes sinuspersici TaxID=1235591 RepID=A0A1W6ZW28_9HYPH|nr:hypothetical protein CAK95_22595 [Pseudorhodoplanes sinuspersici]
MIVQFVQHLAHPPAKLQAWPSADRVGWLVFIARNIGEQRFNTLSLPKRGGGDRGWDISA